MGEKRTLVPTSNQSLTNVNTFYNVFGNSTTTSLTLTPGIWIVYGVVAYGQTALSSGVVNALDAAISTSATTFDDLTEGFARYSGKDAVSAAGLWLPTPPRYFNVINNTPIYLLANILGTIGGATTGAQATTQCRLTAVRIA